VRNTRISERKLRENKKKKHILCSIAVSWKSCHLWDNVEKYGRARQTGHRRKYKKHSLFMSYI